VLDGSARDGCQRAAPSGVHGSDGALIRRPEQQWNAVSRPDAESDTALTRVQAIGLAYGSRYTIRTRSGADLEKMRAVDLADRNELSRAQTLSPGEDSAVLLYAFGLVANVRAEVERGEWALADSAQPGGKTVANPELL
jgi:hypothetical protein